MYHENILDEKENRVIISYFRFLAFFADLDGVERDVDSPSLEAMLSVPAL